MLKLIVWEPRLWARARRPALTTRVDLTPGVNLAHRKYWLDTWEERLHAQRHVRHPAAE